MIEIVRNKEVDESSDDIRADSNQKVYGDAERHAQARTNESEQTETVARKAEGD